MQLSDTELLVRAGDEFGRRVRQVRADAWVDPTPDTDWNVRDLVNHLVSEHLWVPHLLRGESVASVGDRYDGDVVGDDPAGAWELAWAASRSAWSSLGDDEQAVRLSSGPTPARTYREQMIFDLVVHAWDLARGAGLDEVGDPQTVRRALEVAEENASNWAGSSMFDESIKVDSDDPLERLLGLTGRQP